MPKRLINLRTIQAEKISRGRSWIFAELAAGRFPRPVVREGPNLWDEADIDRWLEDFVARAQERSATKEPKSGRGKLPAVVA